MGEDLYKANEERHRRLLLFNSLKIIATVPGLNRVDLTWFLWQRVVIRIVEMSSYLVYTRNKAPRTNFNKLYFALNSTCDNVVRITLNINPFGTGAPADHFFEQTGQQLLALSRG